MHSERPWLLTSPLLLLLLLLFFIIVSTLSTCHCLDLNDDVLGLIVFKSDLTDRANALSSWTEDEDNPCNWTGITCSVNDSSNGDGGRVIQINLNGFGLGGHISKRGLQKLTYLKVLSLANNNISGSIGIVDDDGDDDEESYVYLEKVDLSHNMLSGPISSRLSRIASLSYIDFSYNSLNGSIPSELFSFNNESSSSTTTTTCNVVYLSLAHNLIEGSIPPSIASCPHIQGLDLSANLLSGQLPTGLKAMPELSMLDLSHNMITGKLIFPSSSSPSLVDIRLQSNFFQGALGQEVGDLTNLEHLDLSSNFLSGELPDTIGKLSSLSTLNVASNIFNGNIPSWVGNLPSLKVLNLSYNTLQEAFPPAGYGFLQCGELETFDLSSNKLTTSISSSIANCSSLTHINLSRNRIQGRIPSELGNLKHLQVLDLSYNNLSGNVPTQLGDLQNLVDLNLSYNSLQGSIPTNGALMRFNASAYMGNAGLCSDQTNQTCGSSAMPKPMVLNPNSNASSGSTANDNPLMGDGIMSGLMPGHMNKLLSVSAILAISAAAAICAGVVIVAVLNRYSPGPASILVSESGDRQRYRAYSFSNLSSGSSITDPNAPPAPVTDASAFGKLVMFTKGAGSGTGSGSDDPRAEEWITAAHALLTKEDPNLGPTTTVYKAVLADGRTMAIKKLVAITKTQAEFETQAKLLGKIEHPNLARLRGFYWTPNLQLLIYDFLPNGNLHTMLHEKSATPFGWSKRLDIALGVARGLAHLHHACQPQVIHYNMKSSNILFDEEYKPKIVDHGLANLLPMLDKYLASGKFHKALGYMAPEFASQSSTINDKCDVYGFGVILLELVTGRRPVEYGEDDVVILCDFVRALLEGGDGMKCVDGEVAQECREQDALSLMKLGLMCASQVPSSRPSMVEVVRILEFMKAPWGSARDVLWRSSQGLR